MTKGFYLKLAADNIKKNRAVYIPYILACTFAVAVFYIMKSLSLNPGIGHMTGGKALASMMFLGSWIVGVFVLIFLFYANSFLLKRRKKEFGVFHILGMEKKHLAVVLWWETAYTALISLCAGLITGIALDKVMFLTIVKVIGANVPLGFFISKKAVGTAILLFAVIFLLIYGNALIQLYRTNPIDLLHARQTGEKEPKTKWLLALLGMSALGTGYYIAVTTKNPVASMVWFFVAALLVTAGTYLLFTAGSIALLKTLRRNKKYYYKARHFISVSGMIYRMKQNAAGLANICILSTMVLVMVSSTTSLMAGIDDIVKNRYPTDFAVYTYEDDGYEELFAFARALQEERGLHVTKETAYTSLNFSAVGEGDTFSCDRESSVLGALDNIQELFFIPLSDYNAVMGQHKQLNDGEILIYSDRQDFGFPVLKLFGKEYQVVETLDDFIGNGTAAANIASTQYIVVPDIEEIREIHEKQRAVWQDACSDIRRFYGFDSDASEQEQLAFYDDMRRQFSDYGYHGSIEARAGARQSFISFYGGFFFLGIFLGVLFTMAAVLIIYYKQISEGYDDKERFEIMQKVGMDHEEVKAAIHSQVLMVFFLPVIVAGMHAAAAFPMVSRILAILNLTNTRLYIRCTAGCFLIFVAVYVAVYLMTAKTYYRIVRR